MISYVMICNSAPPWFYYLFFFLLQISVVLVFSFFFQAEDGIRDLTVTGVQTCALPISLAFGLAACGPDDPQAARPNARATAPILIMSSSLPSWCELPPDTVSPEGAAGFQDRKSVV